MANVAQLDLRPKGGEEFRMRALLEDLISNHRNARQQYQPPFHLALAVWYQKSPSDPEQSLLELVSSDTPSEVFEPIRLSLLWKSGSNAAPFVTVRAFSVGYFSHLLREHREEAALYRNNYEVLFFDKRLLTEDVLAWFNVITEPPGLTKGWYVSESEYAKSGQIRNLLSDHGQARPMVGLVKTWESNDFENCRGILHVEVGQRWVPFTPEGIQSYSYYNDYQAGRPAYFLFEGGSLYQTLKFEVKTAPDYATKFCLLGRTPNDRYPEVYLRAVRPSA